LKVFPIEIQPLILALIQYYFNLTGRQGNVLGWCPLSIITSFDFEVPMLCVLVSSKQGDLILDIYSGQATEQLTESIKYQSLY
jgi:hypothetical protein